MSTAAEHHAAAAETLLAMADQAAIRAAEEAKSDPMAAMPGLVEAVATILAAQVHATLATQPTDTTKESTDHG